MELGILKIEIHCSELILQLSDSLVLLIFDCIDILSNLVDFGEKLGEVRFYLSWHAWKLSDDIVDDVFLNAVAHNVLNIFFHVTDHGFNVMLDVSLLIC